jgi:hypothetical protein
LIARAKGDSADQHQDELFHGLSPARSA